MALIKLTKHKGHIYVRVEVGLSEDFKHDKETLKIQKRVDCLEKMVQDEIAELFGNVSISKANEQLKKNPAKLNRWKDFLNNI
jgi:hypothetical protein